MHQTKCDLIARNGLRCMACGQEVEYKNINWHHVIPRYVFSQAHEQVDDSYENGSLLCLRCHATIHQYLYWDNEYQMLTDIILDHKK